jgi:hypothetical protein
VDRIHHTALSHADAQNMATSRSAPAFAAIGAERVARASRFHAEYAAGGSGIRIEPPPSLACATGRMRAATAALAPPDEPPEE